MLGCVEGKGLRSGCSPCCVSSLSIWFTGVTSLSDLPRGEFGRGPLEVERCALVRAFAQLRGELSARPPVAFLRRKAASTAT